MPRSPDRRWPMILIELLKTRIAAVQALPPIEYHVSPRPTDCQGVSARPRQEARRAIFLTEPHGPTIQAHRRPVGEDRQTPA